MNLTYRLEENRGNIQLSSKLREVYTFLSSRFIPKKHIQTFKRSFSSSFYRFSNGNVSHSLLLAIYFKFHLHNNAKRIQACPFEIKFFCCMKNLTGKCVLYIFKLFEYKSNTFRLRKHLKIINICMCCFINCVISIKEYIYLFEIFNILNSITLNYSQIFLHFVVPNDFHKRQKFF